MNSELHLSTFSKTAYPHVKSGSSRHLQQGPIEYVTEVLVLVALQNCAVHYHNYKSSNFFIVIVFC